MAPTVVPLHDGSGLNAQLRVLNAPTATGLEALPERGAMLGERETEQPPSLSSKYSAFLERVLAAQDSGEAGRDYAAALREMRAGCKRGHWIWYIWPTHRALRLTTRPEYALPHAETAVAWIEHPVLGPRFLELMGILWQPSCGRGWRP